MKRSARHSEAIEVDLDAAALMLEHTRDQWLPEHHAITAGMFHALVEMRRRLEERSATLTRLRRLFGIRTTEKLSAVFPGAPQPANDEALSPTNAATACSSSARRACAWRSCERVLSSWFCARAKYSPDAMPVWWRRLTTRGALVGMAVGLAASAGAMAAGPLVRLRPGVPALLLAQPALWAVPLAFATMVVL